MGPQDGYEAKGSMTPTSTTGTEVVTKGCESVAYQVLTAASTPAIKAYGCDPGGTFIPVRYRKITVAGVESLIDPDTGSGTLEAGDRIIVPNNGYDQIRISTTTGTMTCNATRNFWGGVMYEIQKLIDLGLAVTITQPDAIVGPADPVIDSYTNVAINLEPNADQVIVASAASKQIWVYGYHVMLDIAGSLSIQDEDNTAESGIMPFGITGGATVSPSGNFAMPILKLATDKDLEFDVVTADLDGWVCYSIVSV